MLRGKSNKEIQEVVGRLDLNELSSLAALAKGEADAASQKVALEAIVTKLCMLYSDTFDVKSERMSNRMQGQRFVGLCIFDAIKASPYYIKKVKDAKNDG